MSYVGIGTTEPNHTLEVKGQVFISNVEQGSTTNLVPFEIHSDYTGRSSAILKGARQFRLRATPSTTPLSNVNVDMGIESTGGDYFYISNPVVDTPLGSNAAFRITQAGDVTIGDDLSVTGTISTSSGIKSGNSLLYTDGTYTNIYSNVGIGTTDPQKRLHVEGDAWFTRTLTASNIVGGSPLTLSSDSLVKIEGPGGLNVTKSMTADVLYTGTITPSKLNTSDVLYLEKENYTVNQLVGGPEKNSAIIDTQGRLFMKGNNSDGQLGLGYTGGIFSEYIRTALNITDSITRVACGLYHTMIIAGGKVYGTGYNYYGQLGIRTSGFNTNKNTFTANATPMTNASEIACGAYHTMIVANGTVSGTGYNVNGQLGIGSTISKTTFTANATPVTNATQIACGSYHTTIVANGTVSGTGDNYFGQLGIGSSGFSANKTTFTANTTPVTNVSQIACGTGYTMIIDTNGTVSGTGANNFGQLGIGSSGFGADKNTFTANATPVTNVSKIACGNYHTMIIDTNGTVSGTGGNEYGQLGFGNISNVQQTTFAASTTPVTNVNQIACNQYFSIIASINGNSVYDTNETGIFVEDTGAETRVGVGIPIPVYQLELSENSAAKPGSSAWTIPSDRRIKEDIIDANLDTCLENVKKLKLRYFKLRDDIVKLDPMFNDSHKLGWIAQEVEEVLPKCVTTVPEQYGLLGVKNLDVDQIYVNMFGAIQKLIKENEDYRSRIEVLKNKS